MTYLVVKWAHILSSTLLFGTGLAGTSLSTSDGLTWLGDDDRGQVVQIDPTTGRPQNRLIVAPPGDGLDLSQRDGLLVGRQIPRRVRSGGGSAAR